MDASASFYNCESNDCVVNAHVSMSTAQTVAVSHVILHLLCEKTREIEIDVTPLIRWPHRLTLTISAFRYLSHDTYHFSERAGDMMSSYLHNVPRRRCGGGSVVLVQQNRFYHPIQRNGRHIGRQSRGGKDRTRYTTTLYLVCKEDSLKEALVVKCENGVITASFRFRGGCPIR